MKNKCLNPCGEIILSEHNVVMPWVQVQMMNYLRLKQNLPQYTIKEIKEIELELIKHYENKHMDRR